MEKIVIAFCLFALAFQSVAFAEPYKSSNVPSEKIISQTVAMYGDGNQKILGKFKYSDNHYDVYYVYPKGKVVSRSLIRLDTNIWIYRGDTIVQNNAGE